MCCCGCNFPVVIDQDQAARGDVAPALANGSDAALARGLVAGESGEPGLKVGRSIRARTIDGLHGLARAFGFPRGAAR